MRGTLSLREKETVLRLTSDHFTGSRATRGGKEQSGKKTGECAPSDRYEWPVDFSLFSSFPAALPSPSPLRVALR